MKAVLLANMGAPVSEKSMKIFLKRMFSDKAIIYAPAFVRSIVSTIISNMRYKSSWKKYRMIGGSPLFASMDKAASELKVLLPDDYTVHSVYSYSQPFIQDFVSGLYHSGIKEITVISMYPQASFSTTGSVQTDIDKLKSEFPDIDFLFMEEYFDNEHFIAFWTTQLIQKIKEKSYQKPYLLFSAHAIPQSFIKRGDLYVEKINASAKLISERLNLPYSVGYQSKIGNVEWTKPYTLDHLKELHKQGIDQIIIVPLSFINENLETKYDLDTEIIPYALNEIGIKDICRIKIPESDKNLIKMFYEFIVKHNENN